MTTESKELYNYIIGVELFCSEVSKLQMKKRTLSYTYTKLALQNIISQADQQYAKDYCSEKSCFTEFNYDEVMYWILSGMYNCDRSTEKKIRKYLDEIYNESTILPENFGNNILLELKVRFLEDGYEITKKTVLEEMLWCYMCRMQ